ncbi:MAG: polysaccharide deacetylase family protein [Bacteroidetes bacterium]|nr:polysaccharide deacetylase family protein [Bacteroidota bacterium]
MTNNNTQSINIKSLFRILSVIFHYTPIDLLIHLSKQKLILPFYHTVSNKNLVHIKHLHNIKSTKQFERELDFYLKHYEPIDFFQLSTIAKNNKKPDKKYFFLSFDDGLSQMSSVVAPILKRKGIPATFFLNSKFIDNKNLFYRYKASILIDEIEKIGLSKNVKNKTEQILRDNKLDCSNIKKSILSINYTNKHIIDEIAFVFDIDFNQYLKNEKPYLSTSQVNKLINDGFTIGAHSIDHPQYNLLPINEQLRQTEQSLHFIADNFNVNYKTFAFPFTDYGVSKKLFEQINNIDASFGTAGLKTDSIKNHFQRIPIEVSKLGARNIIISEYLYYLFKMPFNKNIIIH